MSNFNPPPNKKLIRVPRLNEKLAKIVAEINGDGHLQIIHEKDKPVSGLVSFNSKNLYEIKNQIKSFKELFNIDYKLYIDNRITKRYNLFFLSKDLAIFLKKIGVIEGNKTNKEILIPEWIVNGNSKIKTNFLKGMFNTEGGMVYSTQNSKKRWRIQLYQHKNKVLLENLKIYLNQIKDLLQEFNIKSSPVYRRSTINIRKDGSISEGLMFSIEKSSFKNFRKYIGFDNKKKQGRLIKILKGKL